MSASVGTRSGSAARWPRAERARRAADPRQRPPGPSTLAVHGGEPRPKPGQRARRRRSSRRRRTPSRDTQELRGPLRGPHRARGVRPLRQPHPARRRAQARRAGGRARTACSSRAAWRRSPRRSSRCSRAARTSSSPTTLPPHPPVPEPDAAPLRRRGVHGAGGRLRARSRTPSGRRRACLSASRPTNPYNRILDLERFAEIGRRHRVKTVIDATFATPYQPAAARVRRRPRHPLGDQVPRRPQRPAGRRRARHRATWSRRSASCRAVTGAVVDPFARLSPHPRASRRWRCASTRQNENAQALAEFLDGAPEGRARPLRRAAEPPRARHRPAPDAGLRRRGLLRGAGRPRRGVARWSTPAASRASRRRSAASRA